MEQMYAYIDNFIFVMIGQLKVIFEECLHSAHVCLSLLKGQISQSKIPVSQNATMLRLFNTIVLLWACGTYCCILSSNRESLEFTLSVGLSVILNT